MVHMARPKRDVSTPVRSISEHTMMTPEPSGGSNTPNPAAKKQWTQREVFLKQRHAALKDTDTSPDSPLQQGMRTCPFDALGRLLTTPDIMAAWDSDSDASDEDDESVGTIPNLFGGNFY